MSLKLAQRRWRQASTRRVTSSRRPSSRCSQGSATCVSCCRHPPERPHRPRAERRAGGTRHPLVGAGADCMLPPAGCRPGRDVRILRRSRGAHERRQARALQPRAGWRAVENVSATSKFTTTGSAAPNPPTGSGLRGLADRVSALGEARDREPCRGRHDGQSADCLRRTGGRPVCGTPQPQHERRLGAFSSLITFL